MTIENKSEPTKDVPPATGRDAGVATPRRQVDVDRAAGQRLADVAADHLVGVGRRRRPLRVSTVQHGRRQRLPPRPRR